MVRVSSFWAFPSGPVLLKTKTVLPSSRGAEGTMSFVFPTIFTLIPFGKLNVLIPFSLPIVSQAAVNAVLCLFKRLVILILSPKESLLSGEAAAAGATAGCAGGAAAGTVAGAGCACGATGALAAVVPGATDGAADAVTGLFVGAAGAAAAASFFAPNSEWLFQAFRVWGPNAPSAFCPSFT